MPSACKTPCWRNRGSCRSRFPRGGGRQPDAPAAADLPFPRPPHSRRRNDYLGDHAANCRPGFAVRAPDRSHGAAGSVGRRRGSGRDPRRLAVGGGRQYDRSAAPTGNRRRGVRQPRSHAAEMAPAGKRHVGTIARTDQPARPLLPAGAMACGTAGLLRRQVAPRGGRRSDAAGQAPGGHPAAGGVATRFPGEIRLQRPAPRARPAAAGIAGFGGDLRGCPAAGAAGPSDGGSSSPTRTCSTSSIARGFSPPAKR